MKDNKRGDFKNLKRDFKNLKRDSDQISRSSQEEEAEDLKAVSHSLKKVRKDDEYQTKKSSTSNKNEIIILESQEEQGSQAPKRIETTLFPEENYEQVVPQEHDPILWINKLRYYPKDKVLPNMLAFREVLIEDLNADNPNRTLQSAFVTSFGYNMELLEPILKTGVKIVLANEWSKLEEPRIEKNVEGYSNFTIIRPPKDPQMAFRGAFHPKLWVLKFSNFLRVAVATGNLTAGDWIIWSNGLWFKDFPLKSLKPEFENKKIPEPGEFDFNEDFRQTLNHFLQALIPKKIEYPSLLGFNLDDYYITGVDIVLVPSLPGRFQDGDMDKYGLRRIGAIVRRLMPQVKPAKPKKYVLTYQTSSLGNLTERFVKDMLVTLLPNYATMDRLKADAKNKGALIPGGETMYKRLRIIYPTRDYVENCIEGPQYSGCLLLSSDNYDKPTFPKTVFHQFRGADNYIYHEGIIAHIKVFIVTEESGEIDDDTFIYFGSHNLSPSAWGKYEKDYTQFTISHTELGVLVPPGVGTKERKKQLVQNLPFKFPPEKHRPDQKPWIYSVHFENKK